MLGRQGKLVPVPAVLVTVVRHWFARRWQLKQVRKRQPYIWKDRYRGLRAKGRWATRRSSAWISQDLRMIRRQAPRGLRKAQQLTKTVQRKLMEAVRGSCLLIEVQRLRALLRKFDVAWEGQTERKVIETQQALRRLNREALRNEGVLLASQLREAHHLMDQRDLLNRGGAHALRARGAVAFLEALGMKLSLLQMQRRPRQELCLWRGARVKV